MAADDYRKRLTEIPMFQSLGSALRVRLCDILSIVSDVSTLEPGDVLYERDSEDANTGAILLEGQLEVHGDADHELEIYAPDLVGGMQQCNEYGQRTATVSAKTRVVVLRFSWHDFVKSMVERPDISAADQAAVRDMLASIAGDRLNELTG